MLKLPVRVVQFTGEVPNDQEEIFIPVRYLSQGDMRQTKLPASDFYRQLMMLPTKYPDVIFEINGTDNAVDAYKKFSTKYAKKGVRL